MRKRVLLQIDSRQDGSRNWSDRLASFIYTQELIWTFLRDFLLRQYSYGGNGPFLKATAAYKIPGEET
ncbi:hypothetical protein OPQ81_003695 [Rhizoctonia solani]|nr:hypothetical protein OPQ81_003695 [Rhizoctonia solani]